MEQVSTGDLNDLMDTLEQVRKERDTLKARVAELVSNAHDLALAIETIVKVRGERDALRADNIWLRERNENNVRAYSDELKALREALCALTTSVDDVLEGWEAHKQLADGFTGMGHNILTETSGKYGSLSCWVRVRRSVDAARSILQPVERRHTPECESGVSPFGCSCFTSQPAEGGEK